MKHGLLEKGAGLVMSLLVCVVLSGCTSTGGISILDSFNRSPEGQRLMNESVDSFVEHLDLKMIAGKSVRITGSGSASNNRLAGYDTSEHMSQAMSGVAWSRYLAAALERKVSALQGRCVSENPDFQLAPTVNAAGLQQRTFYINFFPLFIMLDVYQHRTYWAEFDATLDVKSGDGSRILKTQRHRAESGKISKNGFMCWSALWR